jgi:hypothetical protein
MLFPVHGKLPEHKATMSSGLPGRTPIRRIPWGADEYRFPSNHWLLMGMAEGESPILFSTLRHHAFRITEMTFGNHSDTISEL